MEHHYRDGRFVIIFVLILSSLAFYFIASNNSYTKASSVMFNLPIKALGFSDLHMIRQAYTQGKHVSSTDKVNQKSSTFKWDLNPILVHILGPTLSPGVIVVIGWVAIVGFFIVTYIFIGPLNLMQGLFYSLLIVSPVSYMLAREGSIDMIVYIFVMLLAFAMSKWSENVRMPYVAGIGVSLLTVMNVYPVLSITAVSNKKSHYLKFAATILALTAIYIFYTMPFLNSHFDKMANSIVRAYGCAILPVFPLMAAKMAGIELGHGYINPLSIGIVASILVAITAIILGMKNHKHNNETDGKEILAFRLGAGLFVGTFLLGYNHDYRLIVLLLLVPQLMSWQKHKTFNRELIGATLFIIFALFNWQIVSFEGAFRTIFINELCVWLLFGIVIYLYVCTLPSWVCIGKNKTSSIPEN